MGSPCCAAKGLLGLPTGASCAVAGGMLGTGPHAGSDLPEGAWRTV